ncbi:uncharacterized protein LOC123535976 [Mercenaria mercenaria]|uniref:uncharacterized protein LOC123535976 n=1 Tax=Mercenaria mercenaria TaxID=6596 RepID=UPI00234EB968|nr:uncharacterized protein LOC123535976 [Mercenaria mercenaria]
MQVFVDLCAGQVAVVADLQHGWTEECIEKLTYLLDELQIKRKSCIKIAYFVKPCVKTNTRIPTRHLSGVRKNGRNVPPYEVKRLDNVNELYTFIEKSQLCMDYGGTIQYNHIAWVDFQRTYIPIVTDAKDVVDVLSKIRNEIGRLKDPLTKCSDTSHDKELSKYQSLLVQYNIRDIAENIEDAIERLEHPECDPNLIQTHTAILDDTINQLKDLHLRITTEVSEMDAIMARSDAEHAIIIKLDECSKNTTEVEETIELMMQQITDLPLVGSSIEEAQRYRDKFIESVLVPSRDIVSCATSILQDLDCGKNTTRKSYAVSIDIAKRLTEALQPFTQHLNVLNETYTRIHLFHVICNKTERWKQKATRFVSKILNQRQCLNNKAEIGTNNTGENLNRFSEIQNKIEVRNTELHIDLDQLRSTDSDGVVRERSRIAAPRNWNSVLQTFNKKHPPPKKKHIRLLNKFVPKQIQEKQRTDAEVLAERVLFILQMLKRTEFKCEDISLIQKWSSQRKRKQESSTNNEVSLV